MRFATVIISISFLCCASIAAAEDMPSTRHLDIGIAVNNDRVWRGISQTRGEAALIGEVKWTASSGLFLGLWGSNLSYDRGDTSIELNPFIGYSGKIGQTDLEVGYIYYARPARGGNRDFGELTMSLNRTFGPVGASVSIFFSPDIYTGGTSTYPNADIRYQFAEAGPFKLAVTGHAGRSIFSHPAAPDYTDWKVGISASADKLYLNAGISGSNVSPTSTVAGARHGGTRIVVSATKMF